MPQLKTLPNSFEPALSVSETKALFLGALLWPLSLCQRWSYAPCSQEWALMEPFSSHSWRLSHLFSFNPHSSPEEVYYYPHLTDEDIETWGRLSPYTKSYSKERQNTDLIQVGLMPDTIPLTTVLYKILPLVSYPPATKGAHKPI